MLTKEEKSEALTRMIEQTSLAKARELLRQKKFKEQQRINEQFERLLADARTDYTLVQLDGATHINIGEVKC